MPSPLRSLRVRNYRLFQCGQLISVSGTWVQRVGQDWLLLSLTHDSAGALGVASGLQFLPLAVLLWAQVFTPLLMMRGSMASPGPAWLICASAALLAAIGYTTYRGLQGFTGNAWLILVPAAALAALALLLPLRRRWSHIALIATGLLVMVAGFIAALPTTYEAPLLWPWLAGAMSFAGGHLALAAGMWHERARNLLALL